MTDGRVLWGRMLCGSGVSNRLLSKPYLGLDLRYYYKLRRIIKSTALSDKNIIYEP